MDVVYLIMKRRFGEYVRITRGFFGCSSLWRGDGHYLYVKGMGVVLPFTEEYYRFEFLKIQSIVVTQTGGGMLWSLLCGSCALVSGGVAAACIAGLDGSELDVLLISLAGFSGLVALICLAGCCGESRAGANLPVSNSDGRALPEHSLRDQVEICT